MRITMQAREAAEHIGVSYWKLLELAKAGSVPHARIDGRLLFRKESLDKWLGKLENESIKQAERPTKIRSLGSER